MFSITVILIPLCFGIQFGFVKAGVGCPQYQPKDGFDLEKILDTTYIFQEYWQMPSDFHLKSRNCSTQIFTRLVNGTIYGKRSFDNESYPVTFEDEKIGKAEITFATIEDIPFALELYWLDFDDSYQTVLQLSCIPTFKEPIITAMLLHTHGYDIPKEKVDKYEQEVLKPLGFDPDRHVQVQKPSCVYPDINPLGLNGMVHGHGNQLKKKLFKIPDVNENSVLPQIKTQDKY